LKKKAQFGTLENRIALFFIIFIIANLLTNIIKIYFEKLDIQIDIVILGFLLLLFVLYILFVNVYKKELMYLLLYLLSNILIIFKQSGDFSGILLLIITIFYATENDLLSFYLFLFYGFISLFCLLLNTYLQNAGITHFLNNIVFAIVSYFIIKNLLNLKGVSFEKDNNIQS